MDDTDPLDISVDKTPASAAVIGLIGFLAPALVGLLAVLLR